jgi:Carbohydrate-selective porin, OprB family
MQSRNPAPVSSVAVTALSLGLMLVNAVAPVHAQSIAPQSAPTGSGTATAAASLPAQPSASDIDMEEGGTKTRPALDTLPQLGFGASTDWTQIFSAPTNRLYDSYLEAKKIIADQYNFDFSFDFTQYVQSGTKGNPVWLAVSYPSATWRPFTDTAFGSGEIAFTFGHQAYFSSTNTGLQAARLGSITYPNDWTSDNFSWSTIAYTQTLPGTMDWLSITGGQYNLFSFDPSEYAGNAQTNFISYSFAQDATQTFPNAGLGAYVQAKAPNDQFRAAGGFQGATNLDGSIITTSGIAHGDILGWGNLQWTPTLSGLGDGIYSLLVYEQPFIPNVSSRSTGISFSASQALTDKWGAFLRVNNATGPDIPIVISIDAGGVRNNPFGRDPLDQAGLAFGWNQTNPNFVGVPPGGVRPGEWVSEIYYRYTLIKALSLTPDVQVFWNPALTPSAGPGAVFTVRATMSF